MAFVEASTLDHCGLAEHAPAQLVVKIALDSAPCTSAQAEVVFGMDLVPSAVAAACPVSSEPNIELLKSLDPRIRMVR